MMKFLRPLAHKPLLEKQKIDPYYRKLRWQVFFGIFIGYAVYYFVRKNFALAMPGMIEEGMYNKAELGFALSSISIAYGLSKFIMGSVSDRSNPKIFLPLGLVLSSIVMLCMGLFEWATSSVLIMFILLFLNGWFQGMGWPPCGRTMVHWWSHKERGRIVSIWNCAHNIGGAIPPLLVIVAGAVYMYMNDGAVATNRDIWRQALYYPAVLAIFFAIITYFLMKDTPQSCGLPSIEEYKNDYPPKYNAEEDEKELTTKEILFKFVFNNRLLWYIAIANVFVYLIRYGILDWSPTYLKEYKHFTIDSSSWAYAFFEIAAIPGTLLCGWLSDTLFRGNRGLTGFVFMALVTVAIYFYWVSESPTVTLWMMAVIGFLIYGPVMLIGLHALELVSKKAAGTAAGFTGLFGYLGGSVAASALIGWVVENYGWDYGFYIMLTSGLLSCVLLFITMIGENSRKSMN